VCCPEKKGEIILKDLFPKILIVLDIGAAVVYLYCGDKARAFYWVSAGCITCSTLFIK